MRRYYNQLWIEVQGEHYVIGMTESLQEEAGDISYVELAPLGPIMQEETLVNLEASKAAIEVPAPLSGVIVKRHEAAIEEPSRLNAEYEQANWLVVMEEVDAAVFQSLSETEV